MKHIYYALCTAVFSVAANAGDEFMLAYYVDIGIHDGKYVLQQHGQRLNTENEIYTPLGRGGRGKFSLSLVSLGETTGVLRMEIYDDKAGSDLVKTPAYSLDVEFSKEGAKGDVLDSNEDYNIDFSYSIVPK